MKQKTRKVCSRCKKRLPLSSFYRLKKSVDGFGYTCKLCLSPGYTTARRKKKDHYNALQSILRIKRFEYINKWKEEKGCLLCSESFGRCLELHHLDSSTKEGQPSSYRYKSLESFLREASKCVLLCANCHRKVHAGVLHLPRR